MHESVVLYTAYTTTESDHYANPDPKPYLVAVQYGGLASS